MTSCPACHRPLTDMSSCAKRLTLWMDALQLSVGDLVETMEVSEHTIMNYRAGKTEPSVSFIATMKKIDKDLDVDWFIQGFPIVRNHLLKEV